jgi:hypothetical protein
MSTPRSFWSTLWLEPAGPRARLSRYIVANGYLYLTISAGLYLLPASVLMRVLFLDHLAGHEEGLLRVIGFAGMVIGWFYVMGGRTRAESFGLATVVDRLLAPVALVPLWLLGKAPPGLVLPFAIVDPLMGLGAYAIWRGDLRQSKN